MNESPNAHTPSTENDHTSEVAWVNGPSFAEVFAADMPKTESADNWFREEYERAKARNAEIPPHARMIVTNPILSAHCREVVVPPASEGGQA